MNIYLSMTVGSAVALLAFLGTCRADEVSSPQQQLKSAGINLDPKKHEVRVNATVCLDHGILEYLVCLPASDELHSFEHESIFSTKCPPSLLHLSLLAVGIEPCSVDGEGDWESKSLKIVKSRVNLEVEFEHDGKVIRHRVCDLLKSRTKNTDAVPDLWVFTGSYFGERDGKRVYAADLHGGVIGLGLDGSSVLQFGKLIGNPYLGEETGFEINQGKLPAKGTKVQLIITPYAEK